jgi:hypothetical protein
MTVEDCAAPHPACRGGGWFVTRQAPSSSFAPAPLVGVERRFLQARTWLHADKQGDEPRTIESAAFVSSASARNGLCQTATPQPRGILANPSFKSWMFNLWTGLSRDEGFANVWQSPPVGQPQNGRPPPSMRRSIKKGNGLSEEEFTAAVGKREYNPKAPPRKTGRNRCPIYSYLFGTGRFGVAMVRPAA